MYYKNHDLTHVKTTLLYIKFDKNAYLLRFNNNNKNG